VGHRLCQRRSAVQIVQSYQIAGVVDRRSGRRVVEYAVFRGKREGHKSEPTHDPWL
jgi:hypothetical protein